MLSVPQIAAAAVEIADAEGLVEAAEDGAFGPNDNDGFAFGLRCILDGIAATIAAREAAT